MVNKIKFCKWTQIFKDRSCWDDDTKWMLFAPHTALTSDLANLDVILPLINEQLSATAERSHGRVGRRNANISFNQVPSWIGFLPKMNDCKEKSRPEQCGASCLSHRFIDHESRLPSLLSWLYMVLLVRGKQSKTDACVSWTLWETQTLFIIPQLICSIDSIVWGIKFSGSRQATKSWLTTPHNPAW